MRHAIAAERGDFEAVVAAQSLRITQHESLIERGLSAEGARGESQGDSLFARQGERLAHLEGMAGIDKVRAYVSGGRTQIVTCHHEVSRGGSKIPALFVAQS